MRIFSQDRMDKLAAETGLSEEEIAALLIGGAKPQEIGLAIGRMLRQRLRFNDAVSNIRGATTEQLALAEARKYFGARNAPAMASAILNCRGIAGELQEMKN